MSTTPKIKNKSEEEAIDERIETKRKLLGLAHAIEDEEGINLNDDDDYEKFLVKRKRYDQIWESTFDLECRLRASSVVFNDSEFNEEIDEIVNTVPNKIIIYQTDLEPLNQKLTEFINNPGGFSSDYLLPEFEDVQQMLKEIREQGDCLLYECFVPKEGSEQFDDYIAKILADVKEKILAKRSEQFVNYWEKEFHDGQQRQGKIAEKNAKYEEADRKFNEDGPSTSTAFAQELKTLKEEGKLGEELANEDGEDLRDIDFSDETNSEASHSTVTTSTNNAPEMDQIIADNEPEIIELGSDSDDEHDQENTLHKPMEIDVLEVNPKSQESIPNVESDHNYAVNNLELVDVSLDLDSSIATGESALSPPISPIDPINKFAITPVSIPEGDDDIIFID